MIERKKYNFGFAIPAGHQDGDGPETCAKKELSEEVGLEAEALEEKLRETLPNPCKREGGTHHEWTVMEATNWKGEVKPSVDETKHYLWASREEVTRFAALLEKFAEENKIPLTKENLPAIVKATNEQISWQESPSLEPPMYFLFKKLGIL